MNLKSQLQDWGILLLILGWFFYVLIPNGPAVTFDSVSFLEAGNHFWAGDGYLHTGTDGLEFAAHRFPLYPIILSLFDGSTNGLLILQLLIFAGSLFLFYRVLKKLKSPLVLLLLFAFMMVTLNYYCLWTESLYGLIFLGLLYVLSSESSNSIIWLAVLIALLCLTRMVGLVAGGSLFLAYLFYQNKRNGLVILLTAIVVIGSWTALGSVFLGQTARTLEWHPINGADIQHLLEAIGSFIVPPTESALIRLFVGGVLIAFPIYKLINGWKSREEWNLLFWFLQIHLLAYPIFLMLSKTLIDVSIPFEFRTLFPFYLTYAIWIAFQLNEENKVYRKLAIVVVVPFLIWNMHAVQAIRNTGLGYNSVVWEAYDYEALKEYNKHTVITNDQAACLYWMKPSKEVSVLAEKQNLYSSKVNDLYEEELDAQLNMLKGEEGVIVWFRNGITANIYLTDSELRDTEKYELLHDGGVYLIARPVR